MLTLNLLHLQIQEAPLFRGAGASRQQLQQMLLRSRVTAPDRAESDAHPGKLETMVWGLKDRSCKETRPQFHWKSFLATVPVPICLISHLRGVYLSDSDADGQTCRVLSRRPFWEQIPSSRVTLCVSMLEKVKGFCSLSTFFPGNGFSSFLMILINGIKNLTFLFQIWWR